MSHLFHAVLSLCEVVFSQLMPAYLHGTSSNGHLDQWFARSQWSTTALHLVLGHKSLIFVRWSFRDRNSPRPATPILSVATHDLKWLDFLLTYTKRKFIGWLHARPATVVSFHYWSPLTSGVREVLPSLPTVRTNSGVFLVFIQTGFAIDPPTASHLIRISGYMTNLTHKFVWWCVHKLAVISAIVGSLGSH